MQTALKQGYVQVYTGNGKGKTTAAMGLALRAVGAGLRVWVGQFLKAGNYSEIKGLGKLGKSLTVHQFGAGKFVRGKPSDADRRAAKTGLERALTVLTGGRADVVILDEILVAVAVGVLSVDDVLGLMALRPPTVELVLTGRGVDPRIRREADLVTEMRPVRHYYQKGVCARRGIEW